MAKIEEYAEILVNGQIFSAWKSVRVQVEYHTAARIAQFTVSEQVSGTMTFQGLQIKPGDDCEVSLAGKKIMTGKIFARNATYDSQTHEVLIEAIDQTHELVHGSIPLNSNNEYKNYSFEQITTGLLQPFGLKLMMVNQPQGADKPFPSLNTWPGETYYECIDRLAKMRGMFVRSDADGNLVVGGGSTTAAGNLVEGQNILSGSCLIRDDTIKSDYEAVGQNKGSDENTGSAPATPAAKATGTYGGYRPHLIVAEEPGDSQDMATRVDHEQAWLGGKTIECNVVVQGWLKDDGELWDVEPCYTVTSPMMLLDDTTLGPQSITFSQDNNGGTTTSLSLIRPDMRGAGFGKVQEGAGDGGALPGGTPSPAQPVDT